MIPFIVLCAAVVMFGVERMWPGRAWPKVSGWWARAMVLNGLQVGLALLAGTAWERWMQDRRPWSADALGPTGGAVAGYLVITFVYYWWHRWRHSVDFLWRGFHQVHHSPQRIEIITSFYKHPLELLANSFISSTVLFVVVGLGPAAGAYAVMLTGLAELFYHWNVNTPYWLGFIVQRPEMHCVHHEEGLHRYNYADLPLWDMLFGTFRNPREWAARCGFGEGEHRLSEMLRCVDIHATGNGATESTHG